MTIEELLHTSHRIATEHGFTAQVSDINPAVFSEKVLLMVGELVEAMEEFRAGHGLTDIYYSSEVFRNELGLDLALDPEKRRKPEGVPIELADCVIRIADFCASNGIDLEGAIELKQQYNEGRPFKHGKNF